MKARLRAERLAPARLERERLAWENGRVERRREGYAFVAMGNKLRAWERMERLERRVTAFYGCETSWGRILDSAKYVTHGGTAIGRARG